MDQVINGFKRIHRLPEMKVSMFFKHIVALYGMGWAFMTAFRYIRWQ